VLADETELEVMRSLFSTLGFVDTGEEILLEIVERRAGPTLGAAVDQPMAQRLKDRLGRIGFSTAGRRSDIAAGKLWGTDGHGRNPRLVVA
jgi:hypothetical protein